MKERHDRDAQFKGAVNFCDCHSLVQVLGGFYPTNIERIMNMAEQLHQANVRIICQWLPSHVGISGNKVADKLANAGRFQPQPVIPATMAHVVSMLRGRRAKIWEEAIRRHDDLRLTKLYKVQWTGDYIASTSLEVMQCRSFACA